MYPASEAEVNANRIRFLAALRAEANAARAIQGTIFSRDNALVDGKPKCCAMGIAAELFLDIRNYDEYELNRNAGRFAYDMIDRMLGTESALIESINDSIESPEFSFGRVADELERIWGL